MALTQRQEAVYVNLVDVWRATHTFSATGERLEGAYQRVATNVRCRLKYTQNDSDPSKAGRWKRRTALTEDSTKFDVAEDVRDTDILVDRSFLASGAASPNQLAAGIVQGEPKRKPTFGQRQTNDLKVQVMTRPWKTLPDEIKAAYV